MTVEKKGISRTGKQVEMKYLTELEKEKPEVSFKGKKENNEMKCLYFLKARKLITNKQTLLAADHRQKFFQDGV